MDQTDCGRTSLGSWVVRLSQHISLFGVLDVVVMAMSWQSALACECRQMPVSELILATPFIFAGRVVNVTHSVVDPPPPAQPFADIASTIEVSKSWKGAIPSKVIVHTNTNGGICGRGYFPADMRIIFFAYPARDGNGFYTDWCDEPANSAQLEIRLDRYKASSKK
jgi:hypothetical protein